MLPSNGELSFFGWTNVFTMRAVFVAGSIFSTSGRVNGSSFGIAPLSKSEIVVGPWKRALCW